MARFPTSERLAPPLIWLPALLVLLPVTVVLARALMPAGEAWQELVQPRLGGHLWQSLLLVTSVTLLAVLLGLPAAWQVSVNDFPGRRMFEWMLMLPLAMPGFVAAVAYIDLLEGLIPFFVWVRQRFGVDAFLSVQVVAPWVFAVGVLASTLFPYVFLTCRAVFASQAAAPLEAARMLGAPPSRIFAHVAVPLARPAVAAGASLVAMETMNDYGVVTAFGLTPLTPGIFRAWGEGHTGAAMRLALVLLVLMLVLVGAERWQRGRRRYANDSATRPLARRRCGIRGTALAWMLCLLPLLPGFLIPGWRMGRWAVQSFDRIDWSGNLTATLHSAGLAAAAALLVTFGALVLVTGRRAFRGGALLMAQRVGLLGYMLPSALVAVGVAAVVSWLAAWPEFAGLALSASVFGLLLAYFIRFLAVGIQPAAAALDRVSGTLHHAARTLGASPLRALSSIDLPLIRPALVTGATLAFIDVFKELTLTLVLRPFDFETLATRTYRLAGESRMPEASVPGLMMVLVCLAGLIPLTRMIQKR
jgi:iron(III) transport system permease protein